MTNLSSSFSLSSHPAQQHPSTTGIENANHSSRPNRTLTRGKTLTRPERHVKPVPLINPSQSPSSGFTSTNPIQSDHQPWFSPWPLYVALVTLPFPSFFLKAIGISDPTAQQAWREKIALCSIALIAALFTAFVTVGMNRALCPELARNTPGLMIPYQDSKAILGIHGWAFNASNSPTISSPLNLLSISQSHPGLDISTLFDQSRFEFHPSCQDFASSPFARSSLCFDPISNTPTCALPPLEQSSLDLLRLQNESVYVGYTWDQVANLEGHMVINGVVLNLRPYLASTQPNQEDLVDQAIRHILQSNTSSLGKDATRLFSYKTQLQSALPCLTSRYRAGEINKITPGCFVSQLFLYVSLIVILGVVMVRFLMAIFFSWFLSNRLIRPPRNLRRKVISPAVLPEGANISVKNKNGAAPWADNTNSNKPAQISSHLLKSPDGSSEKPTLLDPNSIANRNSRHPNSIDSKGLINLAAIGAELFCVCLVTCYSEGPEGIKKTLDSISNTDYSDARKLLFVVCDGMITGHGEKISTPDVCVGFLDADPLFGDPIPMSYRAVAAGSKEHNRAMVYAGHYSQFSFFPRKLAALMGFEVFELFFNHKNKAQVEGRRTPMIVVVKCGTSEEGRTEKKPGNRGKRDSQMILMHFFSRVTYNDRMSPLDYDLFRKIQGLMGVTPDFFEVVLMVDADTTAMKDSISHLVNCMHYDPLIMGVCGETRISNKRQSWVTTIQVFEYYISHHLAKAFESVFGGVTCLPGCFSMYRLKARRMNDGDWVPILAQPEICREYSQSVVTTLHQKNLLLLGEDRFLTTLMIRTFPARKMMFCPQARCRTIVPDEFAVLVSQRRRWINSTIHNLMELVRVPNLCGTFCFSMQFVVFMELMGTVVLPIAITLTYSLIINSILHPPKNFSDAIPLILLAAILGLPAILILTTSRKVSYVFWMLIYLIALPVWNFVLPLYAFWHFDDFSWGETRKVEAEAKCQGHDTVTVSQLDSNYIPHRRWEDWERSRLKKIKREERRRRDFAKAFDTKQYYMSTAGGSEYGDMVSVVSSEDDRWGMNIGNYDLMDVSRPPVGLYPVDDGNSSAGGTTLNGDELNNILETGWTDDDFLEPKIPSPSRQLLIPNHYHHHLSNNHVNSSGSNLDLPYAYADPLYSSSSRSHSPINERDFPRPPPLHPPLQKHRLEDG